MKKHDNFSLIVSTGRYLIFFYCRSNNLQVNEHAKKYPLNGEIICVSLTVRKLK